MKKIRHEVVVALLCVAIVVGSGVAAGGAGRTTTATQESASITFNDQFSDGLSVDVGEFDLGSDGKGISIWTVTDGEPDRLLGTTSTESDTGSATVDISPIADNQTLLAAVHTSSGTPTPDDILVSDTATVLVDRSATVVFNDQTSDGRTVDVAEYDLGSDGQTLAVWSLSDGDPDELLASVSPEELSGLARVAFDEPVEANQTLVAAVHSGPPTLDNVLAFDTADIIVELNPIVVGDLPATDSDGDRLLEDVDGDLETTVDDVLAYYRNRNSDVVRNNPAQFDFDGDGTAGTVFDAIKLYRDITG
jgi:PKD repeat protein